jgi:hypothetical protein
MPLFELPLKWVGVRKSTPITLKRVSTPWEKYEQYTDTLAGSKQLKNTQSITDWKQEQYLWDTSIASNKPMHEDIVVLLVFREGAYAKSVRCSMRRTDWLLLSGVLDGCTDSYRVTTGKFGKPTESENNSSSATKENEDNYQSVFERNQQQGAIQKGDSRTYSEGVLIIRKFSEEVFYSSKKLADEISRRTKKRKCAVRSKKSKN